MKAALFAGASDGLGRPGTCALDITREQFEKIPYAAWTLENKVHDHAKSRVEAQGFAVRVCYNRGSVYRMELFCRSALGFTLEIHPADFERVAEIILKGAVEDGEKEQLSRRVPADAEKGAGTCPSRVRDGEGA